MTEREKDYVAAMVLRVVEEVGRRVRDRAPVVEPTPEPMDVWLSPGDAALLRRSR